MRGLSATFIQNLKDNYGLRTLLQYVKYDNTLDIEIRENKFNIYYRGGSALRVTEVAPNKFGFHFDKNYFPSDGSLLYDSIPILNSETDWKQYFPLVKQGMDFYITKRPKEEREFQQLVVRENNYSNISNATDYFIIDIEYDNHKNARFDMVALEWESSGSKRKLPKSYKPKLSIIEMKYGDGALKGSAGMVKHINDFNQFLSNPKEVTNFKSEMITALQQKRELGLMPCLSEEKNSNEVTEVHPDIDFIFLIANHDPASSIMRTEMLKLPSDIKFCASNFTGFGLFKENVFTRDQFIERFKNQI